MWYKEKSFWIFSKILLVKYGLQDSHWVSHSVINYVDAVAFQKRKEIREGDNKSIKKFKTEILAEGSLDKAPTINVKK